MERQFQIRNEATAQLIAEPSRGVVNALLILESFDGAHRVQTLAQMSRRLAIPKATALRHLLALEYAGYVVADARRSSYTLGSKLLLLAQRYLGQFDMLDHARPIIAELAREAGETAHFAIMEGGEVVYLDIAEGPQRVRIYVQRGDRLPAHGVAAGKAILAQQPAEAVERFLAAGLPPLTPNTITDPAAFRAELEATRSRGFALNLGEWVAEVTGVSAPVLAHSRGIVAAIGVAGLGTRLQEPRLAEVGMVVRRHAERLARLLGGVTDDYVRMERKSIGHGVTQSG